MPHTTSVFGQSDNGRARRFTLAGPPGRKSSGRCCACNRRLIVPVLKSPRSLGMGAGTVCNKGRRCPGGQRRLLHMRRPRFQQAAPAPGGRLRPSSWRGEHRSRHLGQSKFPLFVAKIPVIGLPKAFPEDAGFQENPVRAHHPADGFFVAARQSSLLNKWRLVELV